MQKRMQHQGGWAATFVVVGVLLLAGLIGGVYYLKTRTNDQVATNDNTTSEIERALDDASKDSKDTADTQPDQDKTESEKDKTPQSTQSAPVQDTTKLPETGTADVFAKFLAVTALTVASVAYLRSR